MGEKQVEKGNGITSIPVTVSTGTISFDVEYDYNIHNDRKFTKITKIMLESWDLTEIVDHDLKEQINNRIFIEENKEIYGK
jgi:hypothetical protein